MLELQEENEALRQRLIDAGLMRGEDMCSEGCDDFHLDRRPISIRQPAVLPTHSPQPECYQPSIVMMIIACLLASASPRLRSAPTTDAVVRPLGPPRPASASLCRQAGEPPRRRAASWHRRMRRRVTLRGRSCLSQTCRFLSSPPHMPYTRRQGAAAGVTPGGSE